MPIKDSELILNPDGSVYHLNLKPEHIANTIITVGDPARVSAVTSHFDSIEFKIQKREFHTQTGIFQGKRLTVISTGIGTDNIDIVLNELDALVNIDLEKREIKPKLTSLNLIRIGTSGSIQSEFPVGSFILSELAVGFDSLMHFYDSERYLDIDFSEAIKRHTKWSKEKSDPYVVNGSSKLIEHFKGNNSHLGITATNVGFYGPQGRVLRLNLQDINLNDSLASFNYNGKTITNLEMETAGIYGLSLLLGHNALSLNAIIANRATGDFSQNPQAVIDDLISYTLNKIVTLK